jgi:hypothetical protein
MEITFFLLTAQPISINPDDNDKFIQVGDIYTDGVTMISAPSSIGNFVTIKAVENGADNYDWVTFPGNEADWDVGT